MYMHNRTGPWPKVDLAHSKVTRTDTQVTTAKEDKLNVLLDTANLGSQGKAFINNHYNGDSDAGCTQVTGRQMAFGVLLKELENYGDGDPVYVDISIAATSDLDAYVGKGIKLVPFIGFLDSGASPVDGYDATNNAVTDYVFLPHNPSSNEELYVNTQVLLQEITSGGLDSDLKVCVGFVAFGSGTMLDLHYMISANYAVDRIDTVDKMR